MWTVAILAGGQARRFAGRDKSALVVNGQSILDRQLAAIGAIAAPVLLVASAHPATIPPGATFVMDLEPGTGPMGGILTALTTASGDRVLALAADMPFLTAAFLAWLVGRGEGVDIAVPRTRGGLEPLCATYSQACTPFLRAHLDRGALSLHEFIAANRGPLRVVELGDDLVAPFDRDGRLFLNVNTPADYARALALVTGTTNALDDSCARPAPGAVDH